MERVLKVPKAGGNDYGGAWTMLLTGVDPGRQGREAFLGPELRIGLLAEVPVGALLLGFAEERTPSGSLRGIHLALWRVPADVPLIEHSRWRIDQSRWWRWALLVQHELEPLIENDLTAILSASEEMLASQLALLPAARRAAVITAAARRGSTGTGTSERT